MARKIKHPIGPFRPESTSFSGGKERAIELTLTPKVIEIRIVGQANERFMIGYESVLNHAAEMQVKHQIRRGAV